MYVFVSVYGITNYIGVPRTMHSGTHYTINVWCLIMYIQNSYESCSAIIEFRIIIPQILTELWTRFELTTY